VAQVPLPSASDFEELADDLAGLAEEIHDDMSWEDVLRLVQRVCHHPVTIFLRRVCDLVPPPSEE
jgi:hypothetical protein